MGERKVKLWNKASKKDNDNSQTNVAIEEVNTVVDGPVITMENLPNAVADHIEHLVKLEDKMEEAQKRAGQAKKLAVSAKNTPNNIFTRKKAIEALQMSILGLSTVNAELMDAMSLSFADQRKIGEILNQMLFLCVSNLATTRNLIGQFEATLKKAQKNGYSQETKAEMARLLRELKNQEDIMARQEEQAGVLRDYGTKLKAAEEHLHEHESNTNDQLIQTQKDLDELYKRLDESEEARKKSERQYRIALVCVAIGAVVLSILI